MICEPHSTLEWSHHDDGSPHCHPAGLLGEASPDLMRSWWQSIINALLCADVIVGDTRSCQPENGYCHRDLDTRVSAIDVAIP